MRLLMVGTGPFAVPTFRVLHDSYHEMVALVTTPVRTHRGKPIPGSNPMREVAENLGLPIYAPEDINSPETIARLLEFQADLMIVCDYGYILSPEALATARLGGVNLHASLLPKYRGAAPINWAIYNGETESGVTVIHMTPRVDAGPCIAQVSVPVGVEEDAIHLEKRLQEIGSWLVHRAIGS
ncbi:MAG: methionyl-tRNA formyltransferase, partial [Planctomycetia bacterium]